MLKYEWPLLLPSSEEVKYLSQNTFDICEYLVKLINTEKLFDKMKPLNKDETISPHILSFSSTNIGQKATELLRLIPGIKLDVIERCSGHGGSWGIKKENFKMAIKVGNQYLERLFRAKINL